MVKKNFSNILCVSIVVFGISATARAEMPGFYAGLQLGYANTNMHTANLLTLQKETLAVGLPNLKNWRIAYRLNFGYQLNENFAMEIGYRRFGKSNISVKNDSYQVATSFQERAFDLTGKAIVPLTAAISAYGKLGIAYVRVDSQVDASVKKPYVSAPKNYTNGFEPTFGLGVSYAITPDVPIEFSWNRIQKISSANHAPSSDFYALGVSYYFG